MPRLVHGRFRTAVERLPAAKHLHFLATRGRFLAFPVAQRLLALLACLQTLDYASSNIRVIVGGSRLQSMRRTFLPSWRYWESYFPLIFNESRNPHAPWLGRLNVSGLDRVIELRGSGKPIVLAVPHLSFSAASLCYALASRGIPLAMNTVAPNLFKRLPGVEALHPDEAFRSFLALREGTVLLYGADVAGPGVVCRFFGRFVSFPSFFAEIAAQTGAAIMIASCSGFRSGDLAVEIEEPFFPGERPASEVTQEIATRLEATIRAQPFEWFPAGPFLTHLSFCDTGQIPTLVGVLGQDPSNLGERYKERLEAHAGFVVKTANLGNVDLTTLVARLHAANCELLLLVRPELGSEIQDALVLISHLFRFPTDWVAFDPELPDEAASDHLITSFSLSLVKTRVLESLLIQNVQRLDAATLKRARRKGWHCHHVPSTDHLLFDIERWKKRGVSVADLVR